MYSVVLNYLLNINYGHHESCEVPYIQVEYPTQAPNTCLCETYIDTNYL